MKLPRGESAAKFGGFIVGPFLPGVGMFVLSALWFAHGHWVFGVGSLLLGLVFAEFGIKHMRKLNKP